MTCVDTHDLKVSGRHVRRTHVVVEVCVHSVGNTMYAARVVVVRYPSKVEVTLDYPGRPLHTRRQLIRRQWAVRRGKVLTVGVFLRHFDRHRNTGKGSTPFTVSSLDLGPLDCSRSMGLGT